MAIQTESFPITVRRGDTTLFRWCLEYVDPVTGVVIGPVDMSGWVIRAAAKYDQASVVYNFPIDSTPVNGIFETYINEADSKKLLETDSSVGLTAKYEIEFTIPNGAREEVATVINAPFVVIPDLVGDDLGGDGGDPGTTLSSASSPFGVQSVNRSSSTQVTDLGNGTLFRVNTDPIEGLPTGITPESGEYDVRITFSESNPGYNSEITSIGTWEGIIFNTTQRLDDLVDTPNTKVDRAFLVSNTTQSTEWVKPTVTALDGIKIVDEELIDSPKVGLSITSIAQESQAASTTDMIAIEIPGVGVRKISVQKFNASVAAYRPRGSIALDNFSSGGTVTDDYDGVVVVNATTAPPTASNGASYVSTRDAESNSIDGTETNYKVGDILIWDGDSWVRATSGVESWQGKQGEVKVELGDLSSSIIHVGSNVGKSVETEQNEQNARLSQNETDIQTINTRSLENSAKIDAIEMAPVFPQSYDFEADKEIRKRALSGSGFIEWGKHPTNLSSFEMPINEGMFTSGSIDNSRKGLLTIGASNSALSLEGSSRSDYAVLNSEGVEYFLSDFEDDSYGIQAPFPDSPDGSKIFDNISGEVRKYNSNPGIGTEYEAYTINFDGNTWLDLSENRYMLPVGSTVEFKFIWTEVGGSNRLMFESYLQKSRVFVDGVTKNLAITGFNNPTINGAGVTSQTFTIEDGVEYHFSGTVVADTSTDRVGISSTGSAAFLGNIWDIKLASSEDGVDPIEFNTVKHQPKADNVPSFPTVGGDVNPNYVTGYYVDYDDDGVVKIPTFPLSDKLTLTVSFRADDVSRTMWFGTDSVSGGRLYFNNDVTQNQFDISIGSSANTLVFDRIDVGKVYTAVVELVKGSDGKYSATANMDGQTRTSYPETYTVDEIDDFWLGGMGNDGNPSDRWNGDIFDLRIEYPDAPDMNRYYSGFESVNPQDRLTVTDNDGFGENDWSPSFSEHSTSRYVEIPEWRPSEYGEHSIECMFRMPALPQSGKHYKLISDRTPEGAAAAGLYLSVDAAGRLNCNWFSALDFDTLEINKTYHLKYVQYAYSGSRKGQLFVNGVSVSDKMDVDAPITVVRSIGAGGYGHGLNGAVWDVRLIDNSMPNNDRHYPMTVNSVSRPTTKTVVDAGFDKDTAPFYSPDWGTSFNTRVAAIPEWVASSDSVIRFKTIVDAVAADGSDYMHWCGADGSNADSSVYVRVVDGTEYKFFFSGTTKNCEINGVAVQSGIVYNYLGQEVEITIYPEEGKKVQHIGARSSSGYGSINGRIWDFELIDNVDPTNSRFYPIVEERKDVIYELNGTDLLAQGWMSSTANSTFVDNVWTLTDGATSTNGIATAAAPSMEDGKTYILEYDFVAQTNDASTIQLRNSVGTSGGAEPFTVLGTFSGTHRYTGTWEFTTDDNGGFRGIYIRCLSVDSGDSLTIEKFTIRDAESVTSGTVMAETLRTDFTENQDFTVTSYWNYINGSSAIIRNNGYVEFDGSLDDCRIGRDLPTIEVEEVEFSFEIYDYVAGSCTLYYYGPESENDDGPTTTVTGNGVYTGTIKCDKSYGYSGRIMIRGRDVSSQFPEFKIRNVSVIPVRDGTLTNFPEGSEWAIAGVSGKTDGTLGGGFPEGSEWSQAQLPNTDGIMENFSTTWKYNSGVYEAEVNGNATGVDMLLTAPQKAFLAVDDDPKFSVIVDRKDFVFIETWREDLALHDLVAPNGCVQYQKSTHDGVSLSLIDPLKQGYSAYGEWDNVTRGYFATWSTMTNAEKLKWSENPANNIHYSADDGKFYQEKFRVCVAEGVGNGWRVSHGDTFWRNYTSLIYVSDLDRTMVLPIQGATTTPYGLTTGESAYRTPGYANRAVVKYLANYDVASARVFNNIEYDSSISATGYANCIPVALVQRMNQGSYDLRLNPYGTATPTCPPEIQSYMVCKQIDDVLQINQTSLSQCFATGNRYGVGGYIAGRYADTGVVGSGSSLNGIRGGVENTFCDCVYNCQVEDLRLNANKQNKQELLTDGTRRSVAAKTRGLGKVPYLLASTLGSSTGREDGVSFYGVQARIQIYGRLPDGRYVSDVIRVGDVTTFINTNDGTSTTMACSSINKNDNSAWFYYADSFTEKPSNDPGWLSGTANNDASHMRFMIHTRLSSEFDSLPWVDIIGDPARIEATFPNGVVGQYINQMPTGSELDWPLNEKCSSSTAVSINTVNDGVGWITTVRTVNGIKNQLDDVAFITDAVTLLLYNTESDFTALDTTNDVVGDLGDVFYSDTHAVASGNRLMCSLTGDIGKHDAHPIMGYSRMTNYVMRRNTLRSEDVYDHTHASIDLEAPHYGSNAFKALPHLIEKNGLLYIQWRATQLVYDDDSFLPWGDDSRITIVDGETTKTDLNGHTVKVVTHTELNPVGIANNNETL